MPASGQKGTWSLDFHILSLALLFLMLPTIPIEGFWRIRWFHLAFGLEESINTILNCIKDYFFSGNL